MSISIATMGKFNLPSRIIRSGGGGGDGSKIIYRDKKKPAVVVYKCREEKDLIEVKIIDVYNI